MPTFAEKFALIVTEQVSPSVMAEWLADPLFRRYYDRQRQR